MKKYTEQEYRIDIERRIILAKKSVVHYGDIVLRTMTLIEYWEDTLRDPELFQDRYNTELQVKQAKLNYRENKPAKQELNNQYDRIRHLFKKPRE